MCGIAGLAVSPESRVEAEQLKLMSERIRHRGPDDEGYLSWCPSEPTRRGRTPNLGSGRVGLVHRRLSILDLSPRGWQPMESADGRNFIVYNGEVYNFIELRAELEALGHSFVSRSDTEVLLASIQEWGLEGAARRFEGMFAFAVLDTVEAKLSLVRDPFGIKPLYYASGDGWFAFASEIKALLTIPAVGRRANRRALFSYLAAGISDHGEDTAFVDVKQLPPASILVLDVSGKPRTDGPRAYWRLEPRDAIDVSRGEATSLVRNAFLRNVERHLRSDVPVGTALSGGIDSSAIVTAIRRLAPATVELHAFSYFADDDRLSEARWIREAASAARATVHEVHVDQTSLLTQLDQLIVSQDEPFATASVLAQYNVFRAAGEHGVRVMLDGQGADEIFAGYGSYVGPHVASLLRHGRVLGAVRLAADARRRADVGFPGVARYVVAASIPRWAKARLSARVHSNATPAWIESDWFSPSAEPLLLSRRDAGPDLQAQLIQSVQTSLLDLLHYEDRNSMAFSVESRVPFLTTSFAELALSLPPNLLVAHDGTRKAVLRDAMRGIVPDSILDRRDKIGFQTPEKALMLGARSWISDVLNSDAAQRVRGIKRNALSETARSVTAGPLDPSIPLWRWLNLIRWADLFDVAFD